MLIEWDEKTSKKLSAETHARLDKHKFMHALNGNEYRWEGTTKRKGRGLRPKHTTVELRSTTGGTPLLIALQMRKDKVVMHFSMGGKLFGDPELFQEIQTVVAEGEKVLLELVSQKE